MFAYIAGLNLSRDFDVALVVGFSALFCFWDVFGRVREEVWLGGRQMLFT